MNQDTPWKLCRDCLPIASEMDDYLVTIASRGPEGEISVSTGIGRLIPAESYPNDTKPKDVWLVIGADPINEEDGNCPEWESPDLWNAVVLAWAELPRPFTGEEK